MSMLKVERRDFTSAMTTNRERPKEDDGINPVIVFFGSDASAP